MSSQKNEIEKSQTIKKPKTIENEAKKDITQAKKKLESSSESEEDP